MSQLLQNSSETCPDYIPQPQAIKKELPTSAFSYSLPNELDSQLRELRASVSNFDKRSLVLQETRDPLYEKQMKSEIVKLNKEILGLQSDLYKLNSKYISKGIISPMKNSYFEGSLGDYLTPKRHMYLDSEVTTRPSDLNYNLRAKSNNNETNDLILNESEIFLDYLNKNHPFLLTKYFKYPENLKLMIENKEYEKVLLNVLQAINDIHSDKLKTNQVNRGRHPHQQTYEFETKPIDFQKYFKTSFNDEIKTQGILRKKSPNTINSPPISQRKKSLENCFYGKNRKLNTEESMRESRCSSLTKEMLPYRFYNNRSESERFEHDEQGLSIDDIPHKKKIKPAIKKRRNMDIITNLPKKIYS